MRGGGGVKQQCDLIPWARAGTLKAFWSLTSSPSRLIYTAGMSRSAAEAQLFFRSCFRRRWAFRQCVSSLAFSSLGFALPGPLMFVV